MMLAGRSNAGRVNPENPEILSKLDSFARLLVGFGASRHPGGESVLVNGAVFKTVSEPVRAGLGRFDSYTPPPGNRKRLNCSFTRNFLT